MICMVFWVAWGFTVAFSDGVGDAWALAGVLDFILKRFIMSYDEEVRFQKRLEH